jgi:NADH:ubiquinone oxidoreductase subunit 3 (subunit A)
MNTFSKVFFGLIFLVFMLEYVFLFPIFWIYDRIKLAVERALNARR